MFVHARWLAAAAAGLMVGLLACTRDQALAQPKTPTEEMNAAVIKLAEAIEKNNAKDIKEQTAAIVKSLDAIEKEGMKANPTWQYGDTMAKVMHSMSIRSRDAGQIKSKKPGIGVGTNPGDISPDGIEDKLQELANKGIDKATLEKEAAHIEKMARILAAVAEVSAARPPKQNDPKNKQKNIMNWTDWSKEMAKLSGPLAKAAKDKDPMAVKTAAKAADVNCGKCHDVWKAVAP